MLKQKKTNKHQEIGEDSLGLFVEGFSCFCASGTTKDRFSIFGQGREMMDDTESELLPKVMIRVILAFHTRFQFALLLSVKVR